MSVSYSVPQTLRLFARLQRAPSRSKRIDYRNWRAATLNLFFSVVFVSLCAIICTADREPASAINRDKLDTTSDGRFYNPRERVQNGPPLGNVTHKAGETWLKESLKNLQCHGPKSLLLNSHLTEEEVHGVMAYLHSVADPDFPSDARGGEFTKPIDILTTDEFDKLETSMTRGRQLWSEARCSICHSVQDVGGFIGEAPELTNAARKLRRDWLNDWLRNPSDYFPATQMPRFSFSPKERRDLVAYLLRSDDFGGLDVVNSPDGTTTTELPSRELVHFGRRVIESRRCNVCHNIPGIDHSEFQGDERPEPRNEFESLIQDRRCLTCHAIKGHGGDFAPELTTIGSRLKQEWIERFLIAPDVIRPLSQQMPKMKLSSAESRAAAVYAKKHLTDPSFDSNLLADFQPTAENVQTGQDLYFAKGCQACHQIGVKGGAVGPALTTVADRLEPGFIYARLKDPQRFNRNVVEPDYGLTNSEAVELTKFLMSLSKPQQDSVSSAPQTRKVLP